MIHKNDLDQISVFNQDAARNQGYLYTTDARLSSQLATQRSTEVILKLGDFAGRSVLDVGCGDGFYTCCLSDLGHPRTMVGVDAANKAIEVANANKQGRAIEFHVGDAHCLPYRDDSFDLVLLQSILHHDDNPLEIVREAFRLSPAILIHEPNGNNLGLKIIEKTSRYHREHHEKSYTSWRLKNWIDQVGGRIVRQQFAGFVPMFCSDRIARVMKGIEPVVERLPLFNTFGCSVQVLVAVRKNQF
jgi:ubiquinone/menaquinone biosynthesis C-methylase UbiE